MENLLPDLGESKLKLERLYQEKRFTDFVIICNGKEYPVHKWMLSDSCEYFRTMFESEWKETTSGHLALPEEISEEAFQSFLYFLYTNTLPNSSKKAEQYQTSITSPITGFEIYSSSTIATFSDIYSAATAAKLLYPECGGINRYDGVYSLVKGPANDLRARTGYSAYLILLTAEPKKFPIDTVMMELFDVADYFRCRRLLKFFTFHIEKFLTVDYLVPFVDWIVRREDRMKAFENVVVDLVAKNYALLSSNKFPFHKLGTLVNLVFQKLTTAK